MLLLKTNDLPLPEKIFYSVKELFLKLNKNN